MILSVLRFDYTLSVCNWEFIKCCSNRHLPSACIRSAHSLLFVPTDANFMLLWLYYLPGQAWQMLKARGIKLNLKEMISFYSSNNILTSLFLWMCCYTLTSICSSSLFLHGVNHKRKLFS